KELDIDPSEIKYVVVSHTHMDHTAYLQYFKNAEIIIHEDEFNMIQGIRESGEYGLAYFKPVVDTWFDADLKWKLVSGTHELEEILPGVQLLKCGIGHSNGMLGLMVELEESGTIIMTSDAVYVPENFGPPISTPGLCHNREDYIKTVEWIAKLRDANNATIWYGHNMDQFKQLTLSTEGYYE
ncbi:MAG: N-acyl homoserine lactonase family protein, partial [Firmicutes bacterium]|nr:N-acyl homoserine lactonase family protein [Bacillota bacterium]